MVGAPTIAVVCSGAVDDLAHLTGVPAALEVVEVERRVQLVGADVGGQRLVGAHPDLADEDPRRVVGVGDPAPLAPDLMHARLVPLREVQDPAERHVQPVALAGARVPGSLDQSGGHIDAEAVDAPVEPEPQGRLEVRADVGVVPVEVRLGGVEQVQVPPPARLPGRIEDGVPGPAAECGAPVVRRAGTVVRTRARSGSAARPPTPAPRPAPPGRTRAGRSCGWARCRRSP